MALTALRPFVRLSRRLERQVLVSAQPDSPQPMDGQQPARPEAAAEPAPVPTAAEPPTPPRRPA
ncbi:MAG: hypothetical protein WC558_07030, partial [Patulibacter sp.]